MSARTRSMDIRIRTSFAHWSAILSGVLIGIVIHLTMNLIGLSLGLAAVGPTPDQALGVADLPFAVGLWWGLSSLVALFVAGATAGIMSRAETWLDGVVLGATVWALAAIFMVWFATTALGAVLSGAFSALPTRTESAGRDVRLVVERAVGPVQQTDGVSGRPAPTGQVVQPAQQPSPLISALQSVSWFAVLQASRELQDPETRAMLRQYAMATWEDTADVRRALADRLSTWIDAGVGETGEAVRAVRDYVRRVLLLNADEAEALIESWRSTLSLEAQRNGAPQPPAAIAEQTEAVQTVVRRRAEAVANAVSDLRVQLAELIERGGVPNAADREAILREIRQALDTTEAEAREILARWERQADRVVTQLVAFAERAEAEAVQRGEAALDALSRASAWIALSLFLGWIAATSGAILVGRLLADAPEDAEEQDAV